MTHASPHEPIFERMIRALGHDAEHIWHQLPRHHPPTPLRSTPTTPQENHAMSLADIEHTIRAHVEDALAVAKSDVAKGEHFLAEHLPRLADTVEAVASSVVVQTALTAVLGPEDEALIVGFIQRLDRGAHQVADIAAHALDHAEPAPADPAPAA